VTIRCVVFDVDDTLYLERDYVRSGFAAVGRLLAASHGYAEFEEAAWQRFEAGARGRIFDDVLQACGVVADIDSLVTCYRRHEPAIELLPDARDCLERLAPEVSLAAITDGPADSQHAKLTALGVARWITLGIVTADLGEGLGKPHPRSFELVEQHFGVPGHSCAYIGDNPRKDFAGAKPRGWTTVRVRRAGGLHFDAPSKPDVDREILDLTELAACLELVT